MATPLPLTAFPNPPLHQFTTPPRLRRYIDKQSQWYERFRIPHSPLDSTKMGRRLDDVQDVHSFDICFHHLRLMGLQGGNLVLQDTVNIHKDVGGKVLRGWAFVQ